MGSVMPTRASKKQKDAEETNSIARRILAHATGEPHAPTDAELRSQAASILSKLGASKGGQARAKSLSKARRKEIAKKAAKTRWKSKSE